MEAVAQKLSDLVLYWFWCLAAFFLNFHADHPLALLLESVDKILEDFIIFHKGGVL